MENQIPMTVSALPSAEGQEQPEVLVIDDEPSILRTTLLNLGEAGFAVRGFSDPLEALMWASDVEPTCLIVDLKIPGIEGLDLVSAFCALNRHAVILLSAYVRVSDTVEAMRLGVDNVMLKPVTADKLTQAVERSFRILDSTPHTDIITFTRREKQVAELLVAGQSTKQIAQALSLSPRTVEFFRASLLRKTQSPNAAALASALTRLGFYPA